MAAAEWGYGMSYQENLKAMQREWTSLQQRRSAPPVKVDKASRCVRAPQPGTVLLQWTIVRAFPGCSSLNPVHILACRGVVGGSATSVHSEGRAVDIMVAVTAQGKGVGDAILEWCIASAVDWQIQRVIWYRRLWQGNRFYRYDREGLNPHTDHLHIEQNWRGAAMQRLPQDRAVVLPAFA
jgi:GNAT superfamily N-acetyltransferase